MGMSIEEQVRNIKEQLADISTKYRMMQANYNARLKADLVAMLTELRLEIEENKFKRDAFDGWQGGYDFAHDQYLNLIQQKINSLKENKDAI